MSRGTAVVLLLAASLRPCACYVGSISAVPRLRGGSSGVALRDQRRIALTAARASELPPPPPPRRATPREVVEVGALFTLCTLLSLLSDMLTKQLLQRDRSLTATVTFFHFAMSALGGLAALPFVLLARRRRVGSASAASAASASRLPPLRLADAGAFVPLALCQALGFLSTNLSLRFVPVSFSHTVKSCECLFTALLTFAVLRQTLSLPKYLSLLPVAGGVALSSLSEVQFSTAGFAAAMGSNVCFAARSVLSTRLFRRVAVDATTLYWLMCCGALGLLAPLFARQIDFGSMLSGAPLGSLALCGLAHFAYNELSFMILQRTTPITHVVLHAVRRILVISATSRLLASPITPRNWAGIGVAFCGVLGYSLAS